MTNFNTPVIIKKWQNQTAIQNHPVKWHKCISKTLRNDLQILLFINTKKWPNQRQFKIVISQGIGETFFLIKKKTLIYSCQVPKVPNPMLTRVFTIQGNNLKMAK